MIEVLVVGQKPTSAIVVLWWQKFESVWSMTEVWIRSDIINFVQSW